MSFTTDELGHARGVAHWASLPAALDAAGQVTVQARLFVAGRSELDVELAAYFPEHTADEEFYAAAAPGDLIHYAATGALTQYVRAVIVSTRRGVYALPVALVGQWVAGAQATRYYQHMIANRRLQRFPVAHVFEADTFLGRERMSDPAGLAVSRNSPPSPLLAA